MESIDERHEPLSRQDVTHLGASPNDPPWSTPIAVVVWFASVILILVLPNLLVLPYLLAQKAPFSDSQQLMNFILSDPWAIVISVLAIFPAHALTILLAWLVVTRFRRFNFRRTLGWASGGVQWWHYVAILVGFFLIGSVVSSYFPEQDNDLARILRSSRTAVYLVAIMATFTAPIVEEVIYRGILYSAFQRTFSAPIAVIVVTFLFAVVHVPQYYPSYSTIFLLTLLSLVLTLIRSISGNLLPCIILHFLFNGFQSGILIIEPWLPQSPVSPTPNPTGFILYLLN